MAAEFIREVLGATPVALADRKNLIRRGTCFGFHAHVLLGLPSWTSLRGQGGGIVDPQGCSRVRRGHL